MGGVAGRPLRRKRARPTRPPEEPGKDRRPVDRGARHGLRIQSVAAHFGQGLTRLALVLGFLGECLGEHDAPSLLACLSPLGAGQNSSPCSAGLHPAVSRICNPPAVRKSASPPISAACRMQFGDTADWEICATKNSVVRPSPLLPAPPACHARASVCILELRCQRQSRFAKS